MANKRKAREAFGAPQGNLSAFAAARARATYDPVPEEVQKVNDSPNGFSEALAASVGAHPYDGHETDVSSTGDASSEDESSATAPPPPAATRVLSTLELDPNRISRDDSAVFEFKLKSGEVAFFVGVYDMSVTKGCARIYGATLRPNSGLQRIFALIPHAIPQVTAHQGEATVALHHVGGSFGKLERLSPLFKNLLPENAPRGRSFSFAEGPTSLTPLEIGRETRSVLSTLVAEAEHNEAGVRILTMGAKSSGKSTFNRLCCNALVARPEKKCYYLDLDLGQPEFGPPGQVSLIEVTGLVAGPPYTHIASKASIAYKLLRSHTLAATTFKDDPDHYMACARDLVRYYQNAVRASPAPLVVNTCGWVAGVGAKVLSNLCTTSKPTHIISLGGVEDAIRKSAQSLTNTETHILPRQPVRPPTRSPAELRAMQTMSYFHHKPTTAKVTCWTSKPINTHKPWHVSYAGSSPGILAITSYNQTIPPAFLSEVLAGSIVALVATPPDHITQALNQPFPHHDQTKPIPEPRIHHSPETLPYLAPTSDGLQPPLNPTHTSCSGLALVRAIDTQTQHLHLLTPLQETEIAALMQQKLLLVRGAFDTPEWAYLESFFASEVEGSDAGVEGEKGTPWVGVRSAERRKGVEGAVWRLRHPPLSGGGGVGR